MLSSLMHNGCRVEYGYASARVSTGVRGCWLQAMVDNRHTHMDMGCKKGVAPMAYGHMWSTHGIYVA